MENENKKEITAKQFKSLNDIYNFYNDNLFDGQLPQCIINLSRKARSAGFFAPNRWEGEKEKDLRHEISINPDHMDRPDIEWHSTLIHEMCHLWQYEFGKEKFKAYHDKEFAKKMEEVGLITSTTGKEGGKRTGQSMDHYIKTDGNFENAFLDLYNDENYKKKQFYKPYVIGADNPRGGDDGEETEEGEGEGSDVKVKTKNKIKYTCSCGSNVWGKPDLNIKCNECNEDFKPQE